MHVAQHAISEGAVHQAAHDRLHNILMGVLKSREGTSGAAADIVRPLSVRSPCAPDASAHLQPQPQSKIEQKWVSLEPQWQSHQPCYLQAFGPLKEAGPLLGSFMLPWQAQNPAQASGSSPWLARWQEEALLPGAAAAAKAGA